MSADELKGLLDTLRFIKQQIGELSTTVANIPFTNAQSALAALQAANRAQSIKDQLTTMLGQLSGDGALPLRIPVTQAGQTVFNLGGSEYRNRVHLGGILLTENVHYTLSLPYLTLLADYNLSTSDFLIIT